MLAIDCIMEEVFHGNINPTFTVLNQQVQLIVAQYTAVSVDVLNGHQSTYTHRQLVQYQRCSQFQ